MPDVIRRTVVRGPARVLINEITASRPQSVSDILDPQTYESVNNWRDIGVTRFGILEVDDTVLCAFAERRMEDIAASVPPGPFQLVAVWDTSQEEDEVMHLSFRHYPSVQIKAYEGEAEFTKDTAPFPIPTVFVRFP